MMPINLTIYNAAEISDETALKMLSNNFSFSNSLLLSAAQGQKIVASFFIDATNRIYRRVCRIYDNATAGIKTILIQILSIR